MNVCPSSTTMQMDEKYKAVKQSRCMTRVITAQAIVVQDPSCAPIYANQTTLDYKCLKTEDVIAHFFWNEFFSDDLERLREVRVAALAQGVPIEIEWRTGRKDGNIALRDRWPPPVFMPFDTLLRT